MKKLRITPLNIASAVLMTWALVKWFADGTGRSTIGWFLLLLLVLVVADQFFRLLLRSLTRIWIAEAIFVVFVMLAIWVLRVW